MSDDDTILTCPHGHATDIAYRHGGGEGRLFRFFDCADCPVSDQCREPQTEPETMRQVFISDYRPLLEAAKTYNPSEEGKADHKKRTLVERIIANLTRYHDARQARRRGRAKADYQAKKSGTAFNLRQWLRQRQQRAHAARVDEVMNDMSNTLATGFAEARPQNEIVKASGC